MLLQWTQICMYCTVAWTHITLERNLDNQKVANDLLAHIYIVEDRATL